MSRGALHWADVGGGYGRRPVCVLTRDAAIPVLDAIACATIARNVRRIRSEVLVGPAEGLPEESAISCDNLVTVPKSRIDAVPLGRLGEAKRAELDRALRFALDVRY